MPKRARKPPTDPNQAASSILAQATGEKPAPKNRAAVALGRKGGKIGGKARAAKLSPERRSAIASEAARKRWGVKSTDNVE